MMMMMMMMMITLNFSFEIGSSNSCFNDSVMDKIYDETSNSDRNICEDY